MIIRFLNDIGNKNEIPIILGENYIYYKSFFEIGLFNGYYNINQNHNDTIGFIKFNFEIRENKKSFKTNTINEELNSKVI